MLSASLLSQRLQRDARVPLEIERLVHDAHAAVTDLTLDDEAFGARERVRRTWPAWSLSQIAKRAQFFVARCEQINDAGVTFFH